MARDRTFKPPIIIICRDRLTPLKQLLAWLAKVGQERIYLLDNASTYEPMLRFLESCPDEIVRSERNLGPTAPWRLVRHLMDDYFVVTDPDVVPVEQCPADVLIHFRELLEQLPDIVKVGFALKIDDLPDHYVHKQDVITWEGQFWTNFDSRLNLYHAPVDTTFALYRPHTEWGVDRAVRTGDPYIARHLPWYLNSSELNDEEEYYREHLNSDFSTWNRDKLPARLFSPSFNPNPDIIASAVTPTDDGIVDIPGTNGAAAFAVATVNGGASGTITVSADTGAVRLPVTLSICQTDPATGACLAPPSSQVTVTIDANATATFGIFVQAAGDIRLDTVAHRIFVYFKDGDGVIRGSTSVALRTN